MEYTFVDHLPKLLKTAIDQLLQEKELGQWNIQASGETVYVNMKFVPHGLHMSTPVPTGFRKKSPSEKKRDSYRMSAWQERKVSYGDIETNYGHTTCHSEGLAKGINIDQCHSEDISESDHDQTDHKLSDLHVKSQNKVCNENSSVAGHDMDHTMPYMECASTQTHVNENIGQSPENETPKATGIHSVDYDYLSLFDRIVLDDASEDSSKLIGITKHRKIAIYDLSNNGENACDTFQLINADSDCYAEYKEMILDPNKRNIVYTCHETNMKKHLDNMFEMTRDFAIYYPLKVLTNKLSENILFK